MIASLRGVLTEADLVNDTTMGVVVEVNGVGYQVMMSARHLSTIGVLGSTVALAVHTHVREGAITLYGFERPAERRAFELLLGAHGVGPALALAILGALSPHELAVAITTGDVDALVLVPGVGRKTAQRLMIDLAQQFDGHGAAAAQLSPPEPSKAEVREALAALGYASEEIREALEAVAVHLSVEEMLREALRELAPRR